MNKIEAPSSKTIVSFATNEVRRAFPWLSIPGPLGSVDCEWCGRAVYRPARPCSDEPIDDIDSIPTRPGAGERCKWELRQRGYGIAATADSKPKVPQRPD